MNQLKWILTIVLTIIIMSFPKIVFAQEENTQVFIEFDKTSYSQGDTIIMTFHTKNFTDIFGYQIDLKNQTEDYSIINTNNNPYYLPNSSIFLSTDRQWVNQLYNDVATIIYTRNMSYDIGYSYVDKTSLVTIKLKANRYIENIYSLFDVSSSYTDLEYGTTNVIVKLSNTFGETIAYQYVYFNAPTLTLNGNSVVNVEVGSQYTELGVIVSDGSPYRIEGTVNPNSLGTYVLGYYVTDQNGNKIVEITRTVNVVDTTKPEVKLNPNVDTIYVSDTYIDLGVTVTDNYDENPEVIVTNHVNTNEPGEYQIIYTVTDTSQNQTTVKRMVNVIEKTPTITFTLNPTKTTLQIGEAFVDGGCTALVDSTEVQCTILENHVNVNQKGVYEIIYSVTVKDVVYTKTRVVFIYENRNATIIYYYKEEEEIIL